MFDMHQLKGVAFIRLRKINEASASFLKSVEFKKKIEIGREISRFQSIDSSPLHSLNRRSSLQPFGDYLHLSLKKNPFE